MRYIWILYDTNKHVIAVFEDPAHAFTSMERLYGIGLVQITSRRAAAWHIKVKSYGTLECLRHKVRSKPMSI